MDWYSMPISSCAPCLESVCGPFLSLQLKGCSPDHCFKEASRHIPGIASKRSLNPLAAVSDIENISRLIERIDESDYVDFRERALDRIAKRDANDWPTVAVALMLKLPIWTEDRDFFGIGVPTWTTDLVELYLSE